MEDTTLDGNAAAGMLQEIFPFEMTLARATCAGCHATTIMAELTLYPHPMGMVMRCPHCEIALMRLAHTGSEYCLDLQGMRVLQIQDLALQNQ
jgi:hypothetical protein